ncbi:MAG: diguanylate cyclase [Candidatus Woesearchaeota archaeon]
MEPDNLLTDQERSLLCLLREGRVLVNAPDNNSKPLKPLLPRIAYTYELWETFEEEAYKNNISPLILMVNYASQRSLDGVDTNKKTLGSPLENLLSNQKLPSFYVSPDRLNLQTPNYSFESIKKEAINEIVDALSKIRTYVNGTFSSLEKIFYEEKLKPIFERFQVNIDEIKKGLNKDEPYKQENIRKLIDYLLKQKLKEINVSDNPITQSLQQTLVYLQARYLLGYDQEGYDIIVAAMDLEGMKDNNNNLGASMVDALLQVFSQTISEITRERDIGFRYHGSGGDEYIQIFFFSRNLIEDNQRNIDNNPFKNENIQGAVQNFAKGRMQSVILRAVRAELDYIQSQINKGNYKIRN